jgi:hypothetical protein
LLFGLIYYLNWGYYAAALPRVERKLAKHSGRKAATRAGLIQDRVAADRPAQVPATLAASASGMRLARAGHTGYYCGNIQKRTVPVFIE